MRLDQVPTEGRASQTLFPTCDLLGEFGCAPRGVEGQDELISWKGGVKKTQLLQERLERKPIDIDDIALLSYVVVKGDEATGAGEAKTPFWLAQVRPGQQNPIRLPRHL